jgi:hypothetical protein
MKPYLYFMNRSIILVFLILVSGCSRNNDGEYHELAPIDKSMQGFFFKTGSNWIYHDSSTKYYDTVTLTEVRTGTESMYYGLNQWVDYEFYDMHNYSSHQSSYSHEKILGTRVLWNPCGIGPLYGKGVLLYQSGSDTSGVNHIEFLDSLRIGTRTYYHVLECSVIPLPSSDPCLYGSLTVNTDFYSVDSIGLIRKVVHATPEEVWDLISWKINR